MPTTKTKAAPKHGVIASPFMGINRTVGILVMFTWKRGNGLQLSHTLAPPSWGGPQVVVHSMSGEGGCRVLLGLRMSGLFWTNNCTRHHEKHYGSSCTWRSRGKGGHEYHLGVKGGDHHFVANCLTLREHRHDSWCSSWSVNGGFWSLDGFPRIGQVLQLILNSN